MTKKALTVSREQLFEAYRMFATLEREVQVEVTIKCRCEGACDERFDGVERRAASQRYFVAYLQEIKRSTDLRNNSDMGTRVPKQE